MAIRIWIEPVKRPDGQNWYTDRNGLLLRTRFGGPDGEVLCQGVHNAVCESCRVLMSRGIVGAFETWKSGIPYPCTTGDIASTAGLTVHEPDDGVVHFARWRPFDQNGFSRPAVPAPEREDNGAARGSSRRRQRFSTVGPDNKGGGGGVRSRRSFDARRFMPR